jgi:hypothetical protein
MEGVGRAGGCATIVDWGGGCALNADGEGVGMYKVGFDWLKFGTPWGSCGEIGIGGESVAAMVLNVLSTAGADWDGDN